jgi:transposase
VACRDHQVYFLLDLVDELDDSQILGPAEANDPRGEKGFDPRTMTMLLLYACCVGIVSSRKIERACYEDLACRVLTANQQPDYSRISEFRRRNLDALKDLFVQNLRLCQKAGMVSLGHVALDGTKVKANASKHKAMSHERMLRAEKELEKEINALMRLAVPSQPPWPPANFIVAGQPAAPNQLGGLRPDPPLPAAVKCRARAQA